MNMRLENNKLVFSCLFIMMYHKMRTKVKLKLAFITKF
jgi:hypothetical protein